MKSKTQHRRLTLFLILLFSVMSIRLEAQVDSVKFGVDETKVLLIAYENKPKYERELYLCDSLEKEYQSIIINDFLQISACEKVNDTQNILIGKHQEETENLRKEIKKLDRLRRFWKTATGVAIVGAVGYSVYKEVRQ